MRTYHLSLAATALAVGLVAATPAQTLLSDFEGPSTDSWLGSIATATTFANGSTTVTAVDDSGNGVLNLSDGGFGAGAYRTYTGLATSGTVTFSVLGRIVTDPGTLTPNPATPLFNTSFGLGAGSTGLGDQAFGFSAGLATTANDSGQSFVQYAASARADGSGNFTAVFTPDLNDWAVGSGTWVVQLDEVRAAGAGSVTTLSGFDSDIDGWAATGAANSPFAAGSTGVTWVDETGNGVVSITDAGFGAGAFRSYASAIPAAGVHTVRVKAKIVTETSNTLVRARVAAFGGAPTTTFETLSWSQSFATAGDDTGSAFQEVSVPVITSGASDVTVYVFPDYDAAVGSGAWDIRIDDVTIETSMPVPVELSTFVIE